MKKIVIVVCLMILLGSCAVVKPYQMVNLNDPDMVLADKKINKFETNYQVYREGASGANGGKSGGGCGCN